MSRREPPRSRAGQTAADVPTDRASPRLRVGVVGAGRGGSALLDLLLGWDEADVVVVTDPRPDAPGLATARECGIPTAAGHLDVFRFAPDLVLEATGVPAVHNELLQARPATVEVISAGGLRLFWDLLQAKLRSTRQLEARLDIAIALGSTLNLRRQAVIVTRRLAQACEVDRCSMFLWDEATGVVPIASQFADRRADRGQWRAFRALRARQLADVPFLSEVMEQRAPIEITEPARDPLVPRGWTERFGLKSLLVVPIFRHAQVVGACVLEYCREPRRFTEEQGTLAMTLGAHLSLAFENATLYQDTASRAAKFTALSALTRLIVSARTSQDVFPAIARAAVELLGAATARVWIDDPPRGVLWSGGAFGTDPEVEGVIDDIREIPHGRGVVGQLFLAQRPAFLLDIAEDPRWLNPRLATDVGLHGFAGLPLVAGARALGVLSILFREPHDPTGEERELMGLLADHAAIAIENARLSEELRAQLRQTENLLAVSEWVGSTLDLGEVCRRATAAVARALGADMGGAWLLTPGRTALVPVAGYQFPKELLQTFHPVPLRPGDPFFEELLHLREPVAAEASQDDPRFNHPWARLVRHRSLLIVPLRLKDQAIGAIIVIWSQEPHRFTPPELRLAEGIARQATLAVDNARLLETQRSRARRLQTLARLNQVVSASLDMNRVLTAIARAATEIMQVPFVSFWLVDEASRRLTVGAVSDETIWADYPAHSVPVEDAGVMGVVRTTQEPLHLPDVRRDPRIVAPTWFAKHGFTSYYGLPIVSEGTVLAVLNLSGRAPFEVTEDDREVLESFVAQAAAAIRNARLYEELHSANAQLAESQAQLVHREKLSALGQLVAGVAHELNNPLAAVLGQTDLAERGATDARLKRRIERIRVNAERAAQIVKHLLHFARKSPSAREPVLLNDLVEQVLGLSAATFITQNVTVVRNLAPQLAPITGDPSQLQQVIINLVTNACQAMAETGGTLTVRTRTAGDAVRLEISDTGPGVPAELRARIFDPFFTTKPAGVGTGLGLSVVHGIVAAHDGRVWLDERTERGARFVVELPVRAGEPSAPPLAPPPSLPRGLRVLAIDDDPEVLASLQELLVELGCQVLTAGSAVEARARLSRGEIDLVTLDLVMPGETGVDLWRFLEAERPELTTRVIFVTGAADPMLHQIVTSTGRPVLAKPFTLEALTAALATGLSTSSR